jgi:acylphosphatase
LIRHKGDYDNSLGTDRADKESQKNTTIHLIISGKVQGVFFRSTLKTVADSLFVTGWTRNLADGTVEAVLQGRENNVRKVIDWCHIGPRNARVESVIETPVDEVKSYRNFSIIS